MTMHMETGALSSVGFRHVVEDGLAILHGRSLDAPRREFVLKDLKDIISEAKRCSDVAQSQNWFFTNTNREAYELFSLLDRHLGEAGQPWHEWLDAAVSVLEKLSIGDKVTDVAQTETTERFLNELLSCVSHLPRLPIAEGGDLQGPLARF